MSTPFIGEIRLFGFPRIPIGWQACDGTLLAVSEYEPLFTLLGTTFGGDGENTFGVPDLRGRVPLHQGQGPGLSQRELGEVAGSERVALTVSQMPPHVHAAFATTTAANAAAPSSSAVTGSAAGGTLYVITPAGATGFTLGAGAVQPAGGSGAHENSMPSLVASYCIALEGIYPQQQ